MKTSDQRYIRRMKGFGLLRDVPDGTVDALTALRPMLQRIRRGDWRVMVMGPTSARERDEAATFSARLCDLADYVEGLR